MRRALVPCVHSVIVATPCVHFPPSMAGDNPSCVHLFRAYTLCQAVRALPLLYGGDNPSCVHLFMRTFVIVARPCVHFPPSMGDDNPSCVHLFRAYTL